MSVEGEVERSGDGRLLTVCVVSVLVLDGYLLYLLVSGPGAGGTPCSVPPAPATPPPAWFSPEPLPPPAWATPEERSVLNSSLAGWRFSAGLCAGCWEYGYKRLIHPHPSVCAPTASGASPRLLILVSSVHRHREHRALIRATWGSHTHNNTGSSRLLFLLGADPGRDRAEQGLLQEEGAAWGDVLQDDFNSTYRRGGEIQLIMGYRWAVQHCPKVTHIVKVSDDVYVSVPQVLQLISTVDLENSVYGCAIGGGVPFRDPKSRWFTSPTTWPAAHYPLYIAGFFIGVTMPVLRQVLLVSPYIAWSAGADDVIVGMCAEKMKMRVVVNLAGFQYRWNGLHPCNNTGTTYGIHLHGHPPTTLSYLWDRRDCLEGGKRHVGFKNDSTLYKG